MSQMLINPAGKVAAGRSSMPSRVALRVNAAARPSVNHAGITSGVAMVAAMAQASPAAALEKVPVPVELSSAAATTGAASPVQSVDVDSTVDQLISILRAAGSTIKGGVEVLGEGVKTVKEGYVTAEPYLKQGYSNVEPYVLQAFDAAGNVAQQVSTAATPILKETAQQVETAGGFHVSDVVGTVAGAAVTAASFVAPLVGGAAGVIASNNPVTLAEYGLAAFGLYLASPYLLRFVLGGFRGYAGELSAVAAVDLLVNGNALLVDLRSQKEKEASGLPDLPSSARDRVQEVEFATTEDRKLRNALRDPNALETQVTALQVSALKRVTRNSTVLLLDRTGSGAVAVARALTAKGYRKVYVIAGGMDGRSGWLASKLQIKPAATELTPVASVPRTLRKQQQLSAPRA